MSDREKVEQIAAAKFTEQEQLRAKYEADQAERQNRRAKLIDELFPRLLEFKNSLNGRLQIFVGRKKVKAIFDTIPSESLIVSIGGLSPLLQRPHRQIRISTDFEGAAYHWEWLIPDNQNADRSTDVDSFNRGSLDGVIARLSEVAANYLVEQKEKPAEYQAPEWYLKTGNVLGILTFILIWIVCFTFGWAGILLGWIPGLIGYVLMLSGWLFWALLLFLWAISR